MFHSRHALWLTALIMHLALPAVTDAAAADPMTNGVNCRDNLPPLQPLELDTSFAGDGTLELSLERFPPEYSYATKGYLDDTGEAVLFGYVSPSGNPGNGKGAMQRLNSDGSPGTLATFPGGAFGCSTPRNFLRAHRLRSGDFVAGGYLQISCGGIPRHMNVLKLSPTGIRLDEFDLVPFSNQLAQVQAFAEQADGKVVAVGLISQSGSNSDSYDFGVARFLTDGTLDPGFGTNGTFVFDLANGLDFATGVVIDATGRIIVSGLGQDSVNARDLLVLGLDSAGALDPAFGTGGVFQYDRAGFADSGNAVALLEDRILVGGASSPDADTQEMTVLGLTPSGGLDPGFSGDGVATIDMGSNFAGIADLTVGPDGRIYVTGSGEIGGTGLAARDAAVAVLRGDGSPEPVFNGGNAKVFTFGSLPSDLPADIELDAAGSRILVTGSIESEDRSMRKFAAARFVGLQGGMFCDGLEAD